METLSGNSLKDIRLSKNISTTEEISTYIDQKLSGVYSTSESFVSCDSSAKDKMFSTAKFSGTYRNDGGSFEFYILSSAMG